MPSFTFTRDESHSSPQAESSYLRLPAFVVLSRGSMVEHGAVMVAAKRWLDRM
jgi:hypothetical protein